LSNHQLVQKYQDVILTYLFDHVGKKNMKAIILTGSIARNQAKFKIVNGKTVLHSDFDIVIVVRRRALLKSLIIAKKISNTLTESLYKLGSLSHVAISIMTEKSLAGARPSIFMFDLVQNGKVLYKNNDDDLVFPHFPLNDIPKSDIYRLLFNRMIEALDSFVTACTYNAFDEKKNVWILNSIEKLYLSIIQSFLIKEGILVLNSSDSVLADLERTQGTRYDPPLRENLAFLRMVQVAEQQDILSKDELKKIWKDAVHRFKATVEFYGFKDNSLANFDLKFGDEGILTKIIRCNLIFLQYSKISGFKKVIKSIIFEARFGSDHIYQVLYIFFLSSMQFIGPPIIKNYDDDSLTFNNVRREKWLKSFRSSMDFWKHKTGA
jgi:hypothetical protein